MQSKSRGPESQAGSNMSYNFVITEQTKACLLTFNLIILCDIIQS